MIDTEFWRDRRVIITGHTGFKGTWLAQWLRLLGAKVKGYSLPPPTSPNLFDALGLAGEIDHVVADIRDANRMLREVMEFQPDIVFHLAAQPLVRLSYAEPKLTYETNVMGTLNLYEAVRACASIRVVISITTDKCYENREWVWGYRENDPMGGHDPYSSSKACTELLSAAYRSSYFSLKAGGPKHAVALATARAGNVIGGGDWASDRLVPDCVRSLQKSETIVIRSPNATRPWQYVLEPLWGYLILAQKMFGDDSQFCGGWNFGPGDTGTMSVKDVVKRIIGAWGSGSYEVAQNTDLQEAQLLKLDISKARALLRWRPVYGIEDAIRETINIYKVFYRSRGDLKSAVLEQINRFAVLLRGGNKEGER